MKPVNVAGYEHYHVSEEGVVMNTLTGKVLKTDLSSAGYKRVTMSNEGKLCRMTVHRIVALTYISDNTCGLVVNHKDGNKLNNHYSNLEWVTQSQNRKHAFRHRLVRRPNSKLKDVEVHMICASIERGLKSKDIRAAFNLPKHVFDDIRSRRYYLDISSQYRW
jgi:hypothetical protein